MFLSEVDATEPATKIVAASQPITDHSLCRYLEKRMIAEDIANKYCSEISYQLNGKLYTAVDFKNNAGGDELRSEYFKGSSSPKYITYYDNNTENITVFEGFFDFLSYAAIYLKQPLPESIFLVLDPLAFIERSLLLMENMTGFSCIWTMTKPEEGAVKLLKKDP